jgi:hypothetical protein
LGKRRIKELIQNKKKLTQVLKSELLNKGGILITVYRWN